MWAAVGTARRGSVRGYGCAATPGRPRRRRTVCASALLGHPGAWLPEGMGEGGSGLPRVSGRNGDNTYPCAGQHQPAGRRSRTAGARGRRGQRSGSSWFSSPARPAASDACCHPPAAVAWSSPGAPTRAGGCRPTSRGFASDLMTCPALLHLSDRISAVLLDVREHTNGTDRSQRSMARSHIPEPQGRWERPCGTGVLLRVDVVYSQQHTPRGTCSPGRPLGASVQPTSSSTCASTPPSPISSRRPVSGAGSASTNGRS